jgi:dolichol-phosphate mannosyltransferase
VNESSTALTVVIPTRDEEDNVGPLTDRLGQALAGLDAEILFVDDSCDCTPAAILAAAPGVTVPVRILHRTPAQRWGGLGGAVCDGFHAARGEWLVVMDGDLQHPPAVAAELFRKGLHSGADVVVASRYLAGGSVEGLAGPARRTVSRASTWIAKGVFPRRLGGCSDPMSGFFAIRRDVATGMPLNPRGYKILLEILVQRDLEVTEVPFGFALRPTGQSKACLREGARFGAQLATLRVGRRRPRAARSVAGLATDV